MTCNKIRRVIKDILLERTRAIRSPTICSAETRAAAIPAKFMTMPERRFDWSLLGMTVASIFRSRISAANLVRRHVWQMLANEKKSPAELKKRPFTTGLVANAPPPVTAFAKKRVTPETTLKITWVHHDVVDHR